MLDTSAGVTAGAMGLADQVNTLPTWSLRCWGRIAGASEEGAVPDLTISHRAQ